ncbi:ATP-binding protein [Geobacter sp.]|uniref:sensor histidine kinase n=1 Tax=Geobacter sp. TaxID=46610 RepID=UPI002621D29B|nr:ATP-binding protein [Geobacter sp.]
MRHLSTIRLCTIAGFLLGLLLLSAAPSFGEVRRLPSVLVLNSYDVGYDWSDRETDGVRATFEASFSGEDFFIEHLDTKKFPEKAHFSRQAELIAEKYRRIPLDVVIAMDNAALEFALRYRRAVFPRSSIVFCGINDFTPAMIAGEQNITGVAEFHDSVGTIAMALGLHPGTKEVVVIHDHTDTGLAMRHEVAAHAKRFAPATLRFFEAMPMEALLEKLRHLPPDRLVVMLSYSVDQTGKTFTQAEAARLVSEASPVPVYGVHAEQLGHGVVGGLMMGGDAQGKAAARLAVRILRGESAGTIPVTVSAMSRPMFDYRLLKRFDIAPSFLPAGATLINRPVPFYETHKGIFWGGLSAIAVLTTFVIALSNAISRRRQSEEEIRRLNAELEERVRRRTAQLEEANTALQQEIAQREQAQKEIISLNADLFRQKGALETVNKELESFSYSVSHDLQAPLRNIAGFSSLIMEDYGERLDAEGKDYLKRIVAGCKRMAGLIDDLLVLARVTRLVLRKETVDLSALSRLIIEELKAGEPSRYVQTTVTDRMVVHGDPTLMGAVMENLLGNAWKYTRNTEDARIEVGCSSRDGETVYFVRDNGAGFDMRYGDKLFGAFQRLHSPSEYEGSGIGLATVQRIIHRHGGTVWADAEVGKGATFYFSLK